MKRSIIATGIFIGLIIAGLVGPTEKISATTNDFSGAYEIAAGTCDTVDIGGGQAIVTCTGVPVADRNMWGQDVTMGPDGYLYVGTYWDVSMDSNGVGDFDAWYMLNLTTGAIVDSFGTGSAVAMDGDGVATPPGLDTLLAPRGLAWTAYGDTMYSADFDGACVKQWKKTAGKWVFEKLFMDATVAGGQVSRQGAPHGVAVDPNGLVWIGYYYGTDTLSNGANAGFVRAYDAAGIEASFSPINTLTIAGSLDTLDDNNRGMAVDNNGDILVSAFDNIIRIDYTTGLTAEELVIEDGSITKAAVDAAGNLFIGHVGSNKKLQIYDTDLALVATIVDSVPTLQRAVVVSADGKDVYVGAIYSGINGVRVYHSDTGIYGSYVISDTLGTVFHYETTVDTISVASTRPNANIPSGYSLTQNFPNPFNPETMIAFKIPSSQLTTLVVYDLLGKRVRTLMNGVISSGEHRIVWDGRSDNGMSVASGVYLYRLQTSEAVLSKRMLFLK